MDPRLRLLLQETSSSYGNERLLAALSHHIAVFLNAEECYRVILYSRLLVICSENSRTLSDTRITSPLEFSMTILFVYDSQFYKKKVPFRFFGWLRVHGAVCFTDVEAVKGKDSF